MTSTTGTCPGCCAVLPAAAGPTHRYIGASPACWGLYTAFLGAGEPPLGPGPFNSLVVDAYATQHPGVPGPQAIRSVAVHMITLHAILEQGRPIGSAIDLRKQALDERFGPKTDRFHWLTPPDCTGSITIAEIVALPTPTARATRVEDFVWDVYRRWMGIHRGTIEWWYREFIVGR